MHKKETVISVNKLTKDFKIRNGASSLKSLFVGRGKNRTLRTQEFTALKDINVEIGKGEFFGIIGRNGSGKSTLLKILAGVYYPTRGSINIKGSLTPFIELGVGFNPELTGRDNVYLNGSLLGFTRKQIDTMYDEIVDFAELRPFMSERLKNFSSGMQVRLAFSVAVKAKSDVLLIDEVLAVGDTAFQHKCINYFKTIKAAGRTVVFVTHDMGAVERFCDRVLVLNESKVDGIYDAKDAVRRYQYFNALSELSNHDVNTKNNHTDRDVDSITRVSPGLITSVSLKGAKADENLITAGEPFEIVIDTNSSSRGMKEFDGVMYSLSVHDQSGAQIAGADSGEKLMGYGSKTTVSFSNSPFLPGVYSVYLGVYGKRDGDFVLIDATDEPLLLAAVTKKGNSGSGQFYFWPKWTEN